MQLVFRRKSKILSIKSNPLNDCRYVFVYRYIANLINITEYKFNLRDEFHPNEFFIFIGIGSNKSRLSDAFKYVDVWGFHTAQGVYNFILSSTDS